MLILRKISFVDEAYSKRLESMMRLSHLKYGCDIYYPRNKDKQEIIDGALGPEIRFYTECPN